jgi:hypothetical protein
MMRSAMTGSLAILNVGAGDTKLTFDRKRPEEVKRAAAAVQDMLKRGFAILVRVGTRKGEPLYQRVKAFDPKTAEYIIVGAPDDAEVETPPKGPQPRRRAGTKPRRLKADDADAIAVSRSAGG